MEDTPNSDNLEPLPGYESPFAAIRGRRAITDILKRLVTSRASVHIVLAANQQRYLSSMLALGRKEQHFYLDELNSPGSTVVLQPQQRLRVIANLNGAIVNFVTEVHAVGEKDGIAWYRVHRPDVINYRQRRKAFRVPVDGRYSIIVALGEGEQNLICTLRDISAEGVALAVVGEAPPPVERLQRFSHCTVQFPNRESIHCGLEVRNVRCNSGMHGYVIGGRFITEDKRSSDLLSKAITRFERYTIRQRRGL